MQRVRQDIQEHSWGEGQGQTRSQDQNNKVQEQVPGKGQTPICTQSVIALLIGQSW